jgi:hypothetical protein
MRGDPIGQALDQSRLSLGVAGAAHHGNEYLRRPRIASAGVNHVDRLAGIIDEHALAGRMSLPHRRRQPALPGTV